MKCILFLNLRMPEKVHHDKSLFSDYDIHLFKEGKHFELWNKLGAHNMEYEGMQGIYFSVWAPNAKCVYVEGEFNNWDKTSHPLAARWDESGIWEGFISGIQNDALYKFVIETHADTLLEKSDPFALKAEMAPATASVISFSDFTWSDDDWILKRKKFTHDSPLSIYEMHLGSWMRKDAGEHFYNYKELAEKLIPYLKKTGFTHVELMPVMEHPFYGSWGYQVTSYFAPTARYGQPDDFRYLINALHAENIGVILDWVPSHFPGDESALHNFDGTHLYEHADPRQGFHPDWNTYIFNYKRNEVRAFLISNALYWIKEFHADGFRVDAVASMLYLDYSRKEGEWIPNDYGGNENLDAIHFLKEFNNAVHSAFPDVITIAEESTAWPKVTGNTEDGGLGFNYKWMMGWMHDTLSYFQREPVYRSYHQDQLTFSLWYFASEYFLLSFSHDEVVYGKNSLLNKMPGDAWHKFANLRLLFAYMFTHPAAKMVFMGAEFAQPEEWNHDAQLNWNILENNLHAGIQKLVSNLNNIYVAEPALHELDYKENGFEWLDIANKENCVLYYRRNSSNKNNYVLVIANFSQQTFYEYKAGVDEEIEFIELLNTDNEKYNGSGLINEGKISAKAGEVQNKKYFIEILLPPLTIILLKPVGKTEEINNDSEVLKNEPS